MSSFVFRPETLHGQHWQAVLTPEGDFVGYVRSTDGGWQAEPENSTERFPSKEKAAEALALRRPGGGDV